MPMDAVRVPNLRSARRTLSGRTDVAPASLKSTVSPDSPSMMANVSPLQPPIVEILRSTERHVSMENQSAPKVLI